MLSQELRWTLGCFAAGAAVLAACNDGGGGSPSGPQTDPSGNRIVVDTSSGALTAYEGRIRTLIEGAIARAQRDLPVTGVTLTVTPDASRAIPGWAIGGRTTNASTVDLAVDTGYSGLDALLDARLPPLTAHELHHTARIRGPGYGETLLDALVSEGLADQYSLELYGGTPPPWITELHGAELDFWLDRARAEFDSTSYNHGAWFFGQSTIPRFAGYAIGHRIVADYQAAHPGESAAELVNTPAEAFRPD